VTEQEVLEDYYARRAVEYDDIYRKPERQIDLEKMRRIVAGFARGRRILEVACGTGHWTQIMADGAESVLATDIGEEVLAVARAKLLQHPAVTFRNTDAFELDSITRSFDAAFGGFWWSHVPVARVQSFLARLHGCLHSGARVLFMDNRYVEGSSTPVVRTDGGGNTYQRRVLANGNAYEILKNFPTPGEIEHHLARAGVRAVEIVELEHYWYASYGVGRTATANAPRLSLDAPGGTVFEGNDR
jgi:demethylmenaquinone methyltransferase/2-methoxy-6-polyprenyl-1,4-benzoquinol methylase